MTYLILFSLMCVLVVVNSYTARKNVPNVNGKCDINGVLVKSGDTYYEEDACEAWICSASSSPTAYKMLDDGSVQPVYNKKAQVEILGCGVATVEKNGKTCHVEKTTGIYPECCNGPEVCP
ncbi:toxin-like protein 14 [Centruroides sculpturatus]|uniref:toxin-like protein 14 n=1 Tax=Centruroides sculpturatus TaxID=218467 RepID=UPI000C6D334B|nr:toxin-like protein 14 [Centruroides sculpturatus]